MYSQCQALSSFLRSRSTQLRNCSEWSQGKRSDGALGSRLHNGILIVFIFMGMSEIMGTSLVLPQSLELISAKQSLQSTS